MRVAAIIPTYNEALTVGGVIRPLLESDLVQEVIVVDDGSTDATVHEATAAGARVIRHERNRGKGIAMSTGAAATRADILFFLDADLLHLSPYHISTLIEPVRSGAIGMTVGLRDRGRFLTWLLPHIAPVLGGERVLRRDLFFKFSGRAVADFGIETVMNAYCRKHHIPVRYVFMSGVTQVIKESKYGFWTGLKARMRMVMQIVRAELEVMRNKKI